MKLIDVRSKETVVELNENGPRFPSEIMEWDMMHNGIAIPPYLQSEYDGKFIVFLDDPLFQKAFREIYFEFRMDHDNYQWID